MKRLSLEIDLKKPFNDQDKELVKIPLVHSLPGIQSLKQQLMQTLQQSQTDDNLCKAHNRPFQCYCLNCKCIICPTCLMFDTHKGHNVDHIRAGTQALRSSIDKAGKDGLLSFEKTENALLDLRHLKLTLEENKDEICAKVEKIFTDLVQAIKQRKKEVLKTIINHYDTEKQKLLMDEAAWSEKQEMTKSILDLVKQQDHLLIAASQEVFESLEKLKEPFAYKKLQFVSTLHTDLEHGKVRLTLSQLFEGIKNLIRIEDFNIVKYKA